LFRDECNTTSGASCGGYLVRFAERCCQQASRVALTKLCRGNDSACDHFTRHFGLIDVAWLFAGASKASIIAPIASGSNAPDCIKARIAMAAPPS
jgi:hypothetical protein